MTEKAMFYHVRRYTITGFKNISVLEKLWKNYIVPLGYYTDSVKHALIALGCSHRTFLGYYVDDYLLTDPQALKTFASQQYTKAIHYTARDMQELSPITVRTSLVCCLVFVCFEIVQGHYDKAMQHLRSGSNILMSLSQAAANVETTPTSSYQKCMVETVQKYYDQLCDIADMFNCIGCDTAFLLEDGGVIPDLSFFHRSPGDEDTSKPYSSATEARYDLYRVDQAFGAAVGYSFRGNMPTSWNTFLNMPTDSDAINDDAWSAAWTSGRYFFDLWNARFNAYHLQLKSSSSVSKSELWEARLLAFIQKDWTVMIKCCEAPSPQPPHRGLIEELLEEAEALVNSEEGRLENPVFTLVADMIPRMVFITAVTTELDLQQRAITLLHSMRRKEGMWDSREIASVMQSILTARQCGIWDAEYEKVSLPRLARILLSLKLYDDHCRLPLATLVDQNV
ncbi:C6 zinc finger domain protein [Colletotrichum truncatum]|uniref:C6 zinc finger domain protein n=1 Tax=Colletotrichum truncatum TaxID=5467 RepID=A0ACC3YVK9_COLTU|nr:C6 zinc finger domain protein [Colletotrichum truncatum]KAF6791287.1 C6 zinc finger domain protein [Colletotrichum truncatum]